MHFHSSGAETFNDQFEAILIVFLLATVTCSVCNNKECVY